MRTSLFVVLSLSGAVAFARGGGGGGGGHSSGGAHFSGSSHVSTSGSSHASGGESLSGAHLGGGATESSAHLGTGAEGSFGIAHVGGSSFGTPASATVGVPVNGSIAAPAGYIGPSGVVHIYGPGSTGTIAGQTTLIPGSIGVGTTSTPQTIFRVPGNGGEVTYTNFAPANLHYVSYVGEESPGLELVRQQRESELGCDPEYPVRIWPTEADTAGHMGGPVCADSELVVHPAVGAAAADWFNYDPGEYACRRWKNYLVDPGLEVKLIASRDDQDEQPAQLRVMERRSDEWSVRRTFSLPAGFDQVGHTSSFYVPQGNEIRVDIPPDAFVHLRVCQKAPGATAAVPRFAPGAT